MSTKTRHRPGNIAVREGLAEQAAHAGQETAAEERSPLVQIRAYELWEQAGRPSGEAAKERFWCEAESEILAFDARDE